MSETLLVDHARLNAVTNADPELRAELVELFIQQAERRVCECETAGTDDKQLARAAHALRGLSQSFGAPRLAEIAQALEQGSPVPAQFADLRATLEATLNELARL
jgi:HPt (histidine-containing phosphotransfer) domain-containing protein